MKEVTFEKLPREYQELLVEALKTKDLAYAPYSVFFVGAAVLTKCGKMFGGVNYENAAYGSTVCAERNAIAHALAHGKYHFNAIAVIGSGKSAPDSTIVTPCGACRQVMNEFAQLRRHHEMVVILSSSNRKDIKLTDMKELLSDSFGPASIGSDSKQFANWMEQEE